MGPQDGQQATVVAAPLGPVSEWLLQHLLEAARTHGVVVWYDTDGIAVGTAMLEHLSAAVTLVPWRGSHWGARAEAEAAFARATDSAVAGRARPLVVHVASGQPAPDEEPLAEIALAGTTVQLSRRRMIDLALGAEAGGPAVERLGQQAATLADLDAMAAAGTLEGGLLHRLAGVHDATALVLRLLRDAGLETRIAAAGLEGDLDAALEEAVGYRGGPGPGARWGHLWRHVLLTELRVRVRQPLPPLESLPPLAEAQRERCAAVAARLRVEADPEYRRQAGAVQEPVIVQAIRAQADPWPWLDTVPALADAAFERLEAECAGAAEATLLLAHAEAGLQSHWARHSGAERSRWEAARCCAAMLVAATAAATEAEAFRGDPAAWVQRYADAERGWWQVDALQRALEAALSADAEGDQGSALVTRARAAYQGYAATLAERFGAALARGFDFPGVLGQTAVFHTEVERHLGGERVAYILVDGLRYELGRALLERIQQRMPEALLDQRLQPAVAAAPTVTEVGMAALLPRAECGLGLCRECGKLAAEVGGRTLRTRDDRRRYLRELWGDEVVTTTVGEARRRWAEGAGRARLLVLWHREIDSEGEKGQADTDFQAFERDLEDIAAVVARLRKAGFGRIVLAADHGFLFLEPPPSADRVLEPPDGGRAWKFDRRCWVGQGGTDPEGARRFPFSELGWTGDGSCLFPKGLGVFRAPQGTAYVHGGLSLQELVIPVITLQLRVDRKATAVALPGAGAAAQGAPPPAPTLSWGARVVTSRIVQVRVQWPAGAPSGSAWRIEWVGEGGRALQAVPLGFTGAARGTGQAVLQLPFGLEGSGSATLRLVEQATGLAVAQAAVAYDFLV